MGVTSQSVVSCIFRMQPQRVESLKICHQRLSVVKGCTHTHAFESVTISNWCSLLHFHSLDSESEGLRYLYDNPESAFVLVRLIYSVHRDF